MPKYIYQYSDWPEFYWNSDEIYDLLLEVKYRQGVLKGYLKAVGFAFRDSTFLEAITAEVTQSSAIEGELLNTENVRSSVARHLGLEYVGLENQDRYVDGIVEMMLDATQKYQQKLTASRLGNWQSVLFPTGRSGLFPITVGTWRKNDKGPMQIVSGAMGKERVHFEAPDSVQVKKEMNLFLKWFNGKVKIDPVLKAAVAHLWIVTVHPFDDGNGRVARAVTEMQLTRADDFPQRFYSMSAQIRKQRKSYYDILEKTQRGSLDITEWVHWFLNCLKAALEESESKMKRVMEKTQFWDKHHTTELNERQRKMLNKLWDNFEGKLNTSKWAKMCKCSSDTALRDIQDLVSKKILKQDKAGGRSTSYSLRKVK